MTENTLHWLAVGAIVVAASAVIYMWMQQSQPFATRPGQYGAPAGQSIES